MAEKTYTERMQAVLPRLRADKAKGAAFDTVVPLMLEEQTVMVASDTAKTRKMVSRCAPAIALLEPKVFTEGLVTHPGDIVVNDGSDQRYIYVGAEKMIHSNPTYHPGAQGVYYWHAVPKMKDGSKVFPDIEGTVIAVAKDELWWNPTEDTLFKWTGEDYECPSNFYPGAEGMHQWVKVE